MSREAPTVDPDPSAVDGSQSSAVLILSTSAHAKAGTRLAFCSATGGSQRSNDHFLMGRGSSEPEERKARSSP